MIPQEINGRKVEHRIIAKDKPSNKRFCFEAIDSKGLTILVPTFAMDKDGRSLPMREEDEAVMVIPSDEFITESLNEFKKVLTDKEKYIYVLQCSDDLKHIGALACSDKLQTIKIIDIFED